MGTMSVILYICDKIFLKILLSIIFYGVDVNLQNNYAIELMKWVVYEASRLKNSQQLFYWI